MIDRVLSLALYLDWASPLMAFVNDLRYGPHVRFGIPENGGWGKADIKRLLKRFRILAWGIIVRSGMLMVTVRKNQAKWAYYVLKREGVPLIYVPKEAIGKGKPTKPRKRKKSKNKKWRL